MKTLKRLVVIIFFNTFGIFAEKTWGFIIPSYVTCEQHFEILKKGIEKIRIYHDNPIIIINDHSSFDFDVLTQEIPNVYIELSLRKGKGEMNPYLHYYLHKYFDVAVVIHDSMHLNEALKDIHLLHDIKFIRHFIPHNQNVKEPYNSYNQKFNIKNHDDLILHLISKIKPLNKNFYDFCQHIYYKKAQWLGCFGIQSIITWDFLNNLQKKTNILDFMDFMKDRRDRMAMESIFGLACLYTINSDLSILKNSYDGLETTLFASTKIFEKIPVGR